MIKNVIVPGGNMMQSDHMLFPHSQVPVLEWPQHFHDMLDNGPFILCCEEWLVLTVFWILEPLAGEFL